MKKKTFHLHIEAVYEDEDDYKHILSGRKERKDFPQNYGTLDDIKI
ncbi:MAG: hypothetical protein WC390_09240 [Sulfurimonas sp.]